MRVLLIGQLPRELGGSYTTGIARVCEGLYRESIDGVDLYWYFTNVKQRVANKIDQGDGHYYGYSLLPFSMLKNIIRHPIETYNQWTHYRKICLVNPIRFEFYKANMIRVLRRIKPDIIHMHSDGVAPLFYANSSFRIPILLTFHGIMFNPDTNVWEQNKDEVLSRISMSDYYTVLNKEVKRKALALGVDEKKLWIVPNGTNSSKFFYSSDKRLYIRKQLEVGEETFVFMTTGVVIDRKGQYDFLIWLNSLGIDYQYWIVGKGPDENKILEYIDRNRLSSKVKMLGYIDSREMYQYLSAADVYAHVSTTEGQAMSEIEAYSTGLHTIVRDTIKDTVIGNPDDSNHYCVINLTSTNVSERDKVISWLNQIKQMERKSQTGCDWSIVSQKYGIIYKQITKFSD